MQNIENGPGWSPDGGYFWAKNNVLYWEDGDVTDLRPGGVFVRVAPSVAPFITEGGEDFSAWPDEKRAAIWAESQARYAKYRAQEEERERVVEQLRKSAAAKLTPEECAACGLQT